MKKKLIVLLFGGLLLMASCVQYTCPTYTKDTIDKEKNTEEVRS
jgi:hypothetical protein